MLFPSELATGDGDGKEKKLELTLLRGFRHSLKYA
jgi:hypothetical protein